MRTVIPDDLLAAFGYVLILTGCAILLVNYVPTRARRKNGCPIVSPNTRWPTNGEALTTRYMRDEIEGPEYVAQADVLLAAGTFDEPLPASGGLGHGIYVGNEVPVIVNLSVRAGHDF